MKTREDYSAASEDSMAYLVMDTLIGLVLSLACGVLE